MLGPTLAYPFKRYQCIINVVNWMCYQDHAADKVKGTSQMPYGTPVQGSSSPQLAALGEDSMCIRILTAIPALGLEFCL